MKNYHLKKKCALCNKKKLNPYLFLPAVPVGEQLHFNRKKIYSVKMDYYQCLSCGHVQLKYIPNLKLLWKSNYTFIPSQNPLLIDHFLKTIIYLKKKKYLRKSNSIFEIGANDGLFLNLLKKNCTIDKLIGIDPAKIPVKFANDKYKIKIILDYFNERNSLKILKKYKKFNLIIANNCFAHMENLNDFFRGVVNLLSNSGYFVFETSSLLDVTRKLLIGTMIHEHMSVHSVQCLSLFFNKYNMEIVDLIHNEKIQGGVFIGIAKFINKHNIINPKVEDMITKEKKEKLEKYNKLMTFNTKFHFKLKRFSQIIHSTIKDNKIIAIGASRSAGIILKLLKLESKIKYFLDSDPNKINKLFPLGYIAIKDMGDETNYLNTKFFIITGWAQTNKIIFHLKKKCKIKNFYIIKIYPIMEIVKVA
jgi:2-polyprenyl-3-methyl-5-hydroxy-6-metoxy-1,4-benzoquinol methylase